jgi:rhamnosyltransferase subunit B
LDNGKAEILACTLGTRGDILPFLALCASFVRRGHRVTVLTNSNWKDLVLQIGADFHEIAEEDAPQSARDDRAFYHSSTYPSFARSFSFIQQKAERNPECAVLYRFNMLGAECAAQKFGLSSVKIALQPSVIRSVERPPWPLTGLAQGRFAALSKRSVIPALYGFGALAAQYRENGNRFRNSVGLPSLPLGARGESEDLYLVLCPDWFAMPQKDWPARSRLTGFLYHDKAFCDLQLDAFIAAHGAPIVFTPGTGVTDVEGFFRQAAALCGELALPGVFLSPALRDVRRLWSGDILVLEYAELHSLLPRSRMLVHHGGIGSTAQAIRAGIPQILLPGRFDQPDNALRVAILGLGGAVFSARPQVSELADMARKILASDTIRSQLKAAAELVRSHASVDLAARLIGEVIERSFGSLPEMDGRQWEGEPACKA